MKKMRYDGILRDKQDSNGVTKDVVWADEGEEVLHEIAQNNIDDLSNSKQVL